MNSPSAADTDGVAVGGRDLHALPKGHLHIHLEGAMRPQTLRELAGNYGIPVPAIRGYGSFPAFAQMYVAACQVLQRMEDLQRLVSEVVEDAVQDGAVWVEPSFYAPHHRSRLGDDEEVLEAVLEAGTAAAARHGIGFGVMVAADRTTDPTEAVEIARLASKYAGRGVVAFGLANDEALFPPEPFAPAFALAREAGLLSTPHAGELRGADSVLGALDALGADRIQHGVRAIEDPELVRRLADTGVCLDVCPTSNVLLSVVPQLSEHPLPALLAAGVRCSINGDDPLLFGPGLLEEYATCRTTLGLSDEQLAAVAKASIEHSGAPENLVRDAVPQIDAWLKAPSPGLPCD